MSESEDLNQALTSGTNRPKEVKTYRHEPWRKATGSSQFAKLGLLVPVAIWLCGCQSHVSKVWVDVDQVGADARVPTPGAVPMPTPPKPFPSESYSIQGRPASTVVLPGSGKQSADINRQIEESQEAAHKLLRNRLTQIYAQQAKLYEQEQLRLLGDPTSRRLAEIQSKFLAVFQAYADKRLPLIFKLTLLAGYPDTNPKSAAPPENARPVPKQRWLEANSIRGQLAALDKEFDSAATDLITSAQQAAAQDRLDVLKKIEEFRTAMNDRALKEAVDPLMGRYRNVVLQLANAQPIRLPSEPPHSVSWPGLQALPGVPKVDSGERLPDIAQDRLLIRRQLEIWLALTKRSLAPRPAKGVPDETLEFEDWRRRQKVGH